MIELVLTSRAPETRRRPTWSSNGGVNTTHFLIAPSLGKRRWPVERANAWLLENKRLGLRYDRLGFIVESLLQAACIFLVAPRLAREF